MAKMRVQMTDASVARDLGRNESGLEKLLEEHFSWKREQAGAVAPAHTQRLGQCCRVRKGTAADEEPVRRGETRQRLDQPAPEGALVNGFGFGQIGDRSLNSGNISVALLIFETFDGEDG